jgi:hypothetical protein
MVGNAVVSGLTLPNPASEISWTVLSAEKFPKGVPQVANDVSEHKTWIAVTGKDIKLFSPPLDS